MDLGILEVVIRQFRTQRSKSKSPVAVKRGPLQGSTRTGLCKSIAQMHSLALDFTCARYPMIAIMEPFFVADPPL